MDNINLEDKISLEDIGPRIGYRRELSGIRGDELKELHSLIGKILNIGKDRVAHLRRDIEKGCIEEKHLPVASLYLHILGYDSGHPFIGAIKKKYEEFVYPPPVDLSHWDETISKFRAPRADI